MLRAEKAWDGDTKFSRWQRQGGWLARLQAAVEVIDSLWMIKEGLKGGRVGYRIIGFDRLIKVSLQT